MPKPQVTTFQDAIDVPDSGNPLKFAIKQLAREYCAYLKRENPQWNIRPEEIPVKIDSDGLGSGVVDQAGGYRFIPISGANNPWRPVDYPNRRSELWFNGAELAWAGRLSVARLPVATRLLLKQQLLAVLWKVDREGRCQVERKEETKKRLGRSPDDADALNLAYLSWVGHIPSVNDPRQQKAKSMQDYFAERERQQPRRQIGGEHGGRQIGGVHGESYYRHGLG